VICSTKHVRSTIGPHLPRSVYVSKLAGELAAWEAYRDGRCRWLSSVQGLSTVPVAIPKHASGLSLGRLLVRMGSGSYFPTSRLRRAPRVWFRRSHSSVEGEASTYWTPT